MSPPDTFSLARGDDTSANANAFSGHQRRLSAALDLLPQHFAEFQRLVKSVQTARRLSWLFVSCSHEVYAQTVRDRLSLALGRGTAQPWTVDCTLFDAVPPSNGLDFERHLASKLAVLQDVEANAAAGTERAGTSNVSPAISAHLVHLTGLHPWLTDANIMFLNLRRDAWAHDWQGILVWWLSASDLQRLAQGAPDLWSWRKGVFDFDAPMVAVDVASIAGVHANSRESQYGWTMADRAARVAQIRVDLESPVVASDVLLRVRLLDEQIGLLMGLGELDAAYQVATEQQLPATALAKDDHSKAVTLGQVADILVARGQLDEALRILREEELPVYEKLGDVRSKAVTMGKVADILQSRGQLDEALRILREEVLPAFEKLGDVREKAVTMGKVADILQARGQLDEALRIRREEQLPVFEKLGDVREKAVTMGKVADILQDRGQLDEALRIRREEELPVYEKLGDVRALLVGQTNLALTLAERGRVGDAAEIKALLQAARTAAVGLRIPEAEQIADIYKQVLGKAIAGS